jgi:lysophospholipase L1-like esterase
MMRRGLPWIVALLGWIAVLRLAIHRSRSPIVLDRYSPEFAALLGFVVLVAVAASALAVARARAPLGTRAPRSRGQRGKALLALAISLTVSLVLAEIAIRRFDLLGASLYAESWRYALATLPDPDLVYKQQPDLETTYQGVPVRFNELGLRERPLSAKQADTMRILVLGDSVVFGWGVREEETFTRRLGELLTERTGRPVETVNTGVCSYNTRQEEAFLERHGDALAPDAVLLVYVDNDVTPAKPIPRDLGTLRGVWTEPGLSLQLIACKSWALCLLREVVRVTYAASWGTSVEKTEGWTESMESLAAIARWCQARGIPLVTFVYRMTRNPKTDALVADISAVSAREGFLAVDTFPWFDGLELRPLVNSFLDVHPNPRGHEIVARRMADVLTASGIAGAAGSAR